ncbi:alpha/beta-hydrolase [Hypoxylon trugodes]|uniref:alpha/beta-hydrolase n=1 Tax=Hypoxylon trugodes TaxID=326681 RepID=UPI00218D4A4B|nr:alpha/beta-hydrolase [Hypoxylon trugodes]KAI1385567.1 alpha/beta-hydrolase [Hypoxylon trugodes]
MMRVSWLFVTICAGVFTSALGRYVGRRADVPTVDLGYEIHQGSVNTTGDYYIFRNIPYAQQPVGDLRFRKPVAIKDSGQEINNGTADGDAVVMCPQAYPQWAINLMAERGGVSNDAMADLLNNQAGQTEACLVLDVYVPIEIFNDGPAADASVLVWVHGGGFTFGSKTLYGNPAGIIARSRRDGEQGIIVIAINYRLGMFGWLSGNDTTPNLGLYDQRLAFEWVQEYIALFGGNAEKVTAMGESAGASSIVHHITAYGGEQPAPFKSAIPQSPAFQFNINFTENYDKTLAEATRQANTAIDSVKDLSKLSTDLLRTINQATVTTAPTGTFGFGPGPDGTYVVAIPQVQLYQGKFDLAVDVSSSLPFSYLTSLSNATELTSHYQLLISHTANESVSFTPSNILTSADVESYVRTSLPEASDDTIHTLLTDPTLYPDILGSADYPWTTEFERAARLSSDIGFACTARYLSLARDNETFDYLFAYPPGWHADDVPYVFYDGDMTTLDDGYPVNAALAYQLQDYIVAFAREGDPNIGLEGTAVEFPVYGPKARILELGSDGVKERGDDLSAVRCEWIQKAMVDGKL